MTARVWRVVVACAALAVIAGADDGLWLFNDPPLKLLREKYGFEPPAGWMQHLQRASVRFNNGGSGSFASAAGLVVTNHHVAADCIQKLSSEGRDYLATGFHARSRTEEGKCPDLELNVLMSIEDVTGRIEAAVKPGTSAAEAEKARRAAMNTLEKESLDKTGLRSDVVTLYNGGRYHLYRYKKYTDVRLVFAPEKAIAFFGGDPDNFEYPRYDLDISFFRVYENGKPAVIRDYLKWNASGAREGDLVFISGHPGRTDRMDTVAHLEFLRDRRNPYVLDLLRRREVLLRTFGERSTENARRAQDELFSYQNSRKAYLGMQAGLQDPAVMKQKRAEEEALRAQVMASPKLKPAYGDAWAQVEAALKAWDQVLVERALLELGHGLDTDLFGIARGLVRLAGETAKPNAERLREYAEAGLESLKQQLFSEAPIYADFETVKLADSLSMLMEKLGARHELVQKALAGKPPRERAAELVQGTRLRDVAFRKQLAEGGRKAIEASSDPMIALARLVDPAARQVRRAYEEQVEEPLRQAYSKLANARFAVFGTALYPDATFTLRLASGQVKGFAEGGRPVAWTTTLGGAFQHAQAHENREPFALPPSWVEGQGRLKLATPFNFVSTNDSVGGNSGSPVVNRQGEFVGIIFDGNLASLVWDYVYTEEQARSVSVHSAGILEALRTIYRAEALVGELTGAR